MKEEGEEEELKVKKIEEDKKKAKNMEEKDKRR